MGPLTSRAAGASDTALMFSIVTAVYNVGRYLDEFIDSIERQAYPRDQFEVIAVDDGSTDDSLTRLRSWEAQRPGLVTVITKENGGQSTARNLGMAEARGAWVTFTDPDDILRPNYLAEVAAFIDQHPNVSLVATNRLILNDASGEVTDSHPLRRHFAHGNRVRDINDYPDYFHGSAPAAFFPAEELRRQDLRFDPRVFPNWEDGHFCSRYLLGIERPTIGFVASAHYLYRKRADASSTLQGSLSHPGRYTDVLRHGFLDVLQRGANSSPTDMPPEWLQNFVVYELSWYFSNEESHAGAVSGAIGPVADEFHGLLGRIIGLISDDLIAGFVVRPLKPAWAEILLHGYDDQPWHQSYGHVARLDADQGLVKIVYRYIGRPPAEELLSGGRVVAPRHAKIRDIAYHGRVLLRERIVWLSSRQSVRVRLDGRDLDLQFTVPPRNHVLRPGQIRERLDPRSVARRARSRGKAPLGDRLVRRLAQSRFVRRYFRNAWVLMDRISDAGDNAERLFEYLRSDRPDVNAWFVVTRKAPDWSRLRRAHGRRVLAHGSLPWKLAMANCRHLVSSHIDVPIVEPPAILAFTQPTWRFTFLQHGVIKDDLSAWLNPKPIDLFITSTHHEYASIAGDHTPYVHTTKEVKLTGLPRFDRLLALGRKFDRQRDLVLVAPTWRVKLVQPLRAGAHTREVDPRFSESDFARNWLRLLSSPELVELSAREGLTLAFLPHPVLQPALPFLDLPTHVTPLSFADRDVQELFARAAVMVTDYSSMAFNAAYINRALVYFQFDHQSVRGGEHLGRQGYFDYERDGFGPVAYTLGDAVAAIERVVRAGRSPSPVYQARIDATFPIRDGQSCPRVVDEIGQLTRRLKPAEAAAPVHAPSLPPTLGAPGRA